jgi:uncharacterized protein (UPF0332 family)
LRCVKVKIKHKGLLVSAPDKESAKEYIKKAKESLEFCDLYRKHGADYKIPEEWFYSLYYCGLAILAKFGVETRSQKYTALFLEYAQAKGCIKYDYEFVKRILVHAKKGESSEVDEREEARYSSQIKIEKVNQRYNEMMNLCKQAIAQCQEIVYSNSILKIPKELLEA